MDKEPCFRNAKAWSDFIGFHVRMSFLMVLALVALMPAIVAYMIAFDTGTGYSPREHLLEIAFFLFMMALALAMFWKIVRVVFRYFAMNRWNRALTVALGTVVLLAEGFLAVVILRTTYLQALGLHDVERKDADRIGREIWRSVHKGSAATDRS